ncbi:MAG: hypothetical protein KBA91_03440 [Candidatus Moranbacteria bacterium]|jgi:hypothetical protein|nr:hypothetical protein [Candidatus Moranbacteria bacterium]
MKQYEAPLSEPILLKKKDIRTTNAANDPKMFVRDTEEVLDSTGKRIGKTAEELLAKEEFNRENYLAMIGVYEELQKMVSEDTTYVHEYNDRQHMVAVGTLDEVKIVFPPEWQTQLEKIVAKALKIPINIHSNYEAMRSEFESAIRNKTIDSSIVRYAELAVQAESNAAKHLQYLSAAYTRQEHTTDKDGETTVLNENHKEIA